MQGQGLRLLPEIGGLQMVYHTHNTRGRHVPKGHAQALVVPADEQKARSLYLALMAGAALAAMIAAWPGFANAQQGGPAPGTTQDQGTDPFALYGYDTGEQASGVNYSAEEDQRIREYEQRRLQMMNGVASGSTQSSVRSPTEQDIQNSLVYDDDEDQRLEDSQQRMSDVEQAVVDEEMSGGTPTGAIATDAINDNITRIPQSSVDQANAFVQEIDDFQDRTGMLAEDAECNMASTESACPTNIEAYEAAFESGLSTDITNPGVSSSEGSPVPPVTTTMNDLEDPALDVPADYEDQFNQETLEATYVQGEGAYGPDGDPINLDDITWAQYMQSEEERTMDWNKYLEYKVWGFDTSNFEWLGSNRFLMPKNFFLQESMELGPQQEMSSEDQQIAYSDRLITFRQYYDMVHYGYDMSGVRYFGDDLGIVIRSYESSRCDDYYYDDDDRYWNEPYYCDTEAYELPKDFFERQYRNVGWIAARYDNDR